MFQNPDNLFFHFGGLLSLGVTLFEHGERTCRVSPGRDMAMMGRGPRTGVQQTLLPTARDGYGSRLFQTHQLTLMRPYTDLPVQFDLDPTRITIHAEFY